MEKYGSGPAKRLRLTNSTAQFSEIDRPFSESTAARQEIGEFSESCEKDQRCINDEQPWTLNIENCFLPGSADSLLCPEELLLYSLMKLSFKTYTFTMLIRYFLLLDMSQSFLSFSKYVVYSLLLLRSVDFPQEFKKNELKSGVGKFDGEVRWVHFKNKIETFTSICAHDLETALSNTAGIPEHAIFQLSEKLREICNAEIKDIGDIPVTIGCNFPIQFNTSVKSHLSSTWVPWFDPKTSTIHVYCFEESLGYANKEVKISRTFEWRKSENGEAKIKLSCI